MKVGVSSGQPRPLRAASCASRPSCALPPNKNKTYGACSAQPLLRKHATVRLWTDPLAEKHAESENWRACRSTRTQAAVHTVRYYSSGLRHDDIVASRICALQGNLPSRVPPPLLVGMQFAECAVSPPLGRGTHTGKPVRSTHRQAGTKITPASRWRTYTGKPVRNLHR